MAVAYVFLGFSVGPVLVLKQTRNAHRIFYTQVATLVVSLSAGAVLTLRFGVTGAAFATIATYVAAATSVRWHQHVVRRSEADRPMLRSVETPSGSPSEAPPPSTAPQLTGPPCRHLLVEGGRAAQTFETTHRGLTLVERQLRAHLRIDGKRRPGARRNQRRRAGRPGNCRSGSLHGVGGQEAAHGRRRRRPTSCRAPRRRRASGGGPHRLGGRATGDLFVAPDNPAQMADEEAGADADAILILATVDPAVGAEHIAAWASDAVVMVRAGRRVSATWIDAVRRRLRQTDVTIRSAVLVGPRRTIEALTSRQPVS